jgi:hypothetical protein
MPLTLNVGLSRKHGLPNYGSIGASCSLGIELDGSLLQHDLDTLQQKVRQAFVACSQAVNDELARQQAESQPPANGRPAPRPNGVSSHIPTAGNDIHENSRTENGHAANGAGHQASQKQVDYISQLSRQIRGLGVRRLETLANRMFGKPMADLSTLDASGLIDMLKAIKEGRIELDGALNGASV